MTFDPQVYAAIAASNPQAAAQYLASFQAPAPAAAPAAVPQIQAQPQAYVNPAAVQPAPQLANGSLEDFYNQPTSGGGPSVTSKFFNKRPQGSWLSMTVVSDVTNADVRQQTTPQGVPQTFRDGRPKFVLVVKVIVTGSSDGTHVAEFPDGEATLWVKGTLADELRRSMTAGGDPSGYPKGGAQIVMQSAGEKPAKTPGFSATKLYTLQYAGPVAAAAEAIANPTTQAPFATAPVPGPAPVMPAAPVTAAPVLSAVPTAGVPSAPATGAAIPTVPSVPAPEVPAVNFQAPAPAPAASPSRDELLARLHGQ